MVCTTGKHFLFLIVYSDITNFANNKNNNINNKLDKPNKNKNVFLNDSEVEVLQLDRQLLQG